MYVRSKDGIWFNLKSYVWKWTGHEEHFLSIYVRLNQYTGSLIMFFKKFSLVLFFGSPFFVCLSDDGFYRILFIHSCIRIFICFSHSNITSIQFWICKGWEFHLQKTFLVVQAFVLFFHWHKWKKAEKTHIIKYNNRIKFATWWNFPLEY